MNTPREELDARLKQSGTSKMVQALVMPETEAVIDHILDGGSRQAILKDTLTSYFNDNVIPDPATLAEILDRALSDKREEFRNMFRGSWDDDLHGKFFDTWRQWTAPVVNMPAGDFPYQWATGGATEGLRAAINDYALRARRENFTPAIHVFQGEYEGFEQYAAAAGIAVKKHPRPDWRNAIKEVGPQDQFYISQPSGIEGNVWEAFDDFARTLASEKPGAKLMVDLTYVGTVGRDYGINVSHSNIPTVFFSLSKPAGVYNFRIGGCLSRVDYKGLYGNALRKDIMALRIGIGMMENYGVRELPARYRPLQEQAAVEAGRKLGLALTPSDVVLIATAKPGNPPSDFDSYLTRGSAGEEKMRICLTPTLAVIIADTKKDAACARRSPRAAAALTVAAL